MHKISYKIPFGCLPDCANGVIFIFVLHDSMLSSASSERFVCMIAIGRAFIPLCIIYCFVPEYHVNCMTVIRGVTLVFVQD